MSDTTVVIEGRFSGPPDSGSGGYVSGIVSRLVDEPAAVRLRMPHG